MTMTAPPLGHDDEPRHERASCAAKGRRGKPCGLPAGWGTGHPGIGPCKLHTGSTPNANKHALTLIAEAKRQELTDGLVARLGSAPQIDEGEAIRVSLNVIAEMLTWCRDELVPAAGVVDSAGRPSQALEMLRGLVLEMRDTGRLAVALNLEERRIRIEEADSAMLADVVVAVVTALRVRIAAGEDVSDDDVKADLVGRLRAIDASSADT